MQFALGFVLAVAAMATADSNGTSTTSNSTSTDATKIYTYANGQCQHGNTSAINTIKIDDGFPAFSRALKPEFKGAESKNGGGWDVYWSIPQPRQGCRTMVMLPYLQHSGMAGMPGGNEIINTGNAGCFFGNVPTDSDVLVSFCCGSGDCEKAALNATDLLAAPSPARRRRNGRALPPAPKPAVLPRHDQFEQPAPREDRAASKLSTLAAISQSFEHGRRWFFPVVKPQTNQCKIIKSGEPYSVAGQQIVVSRSQTCSDSPCTVAVQFTTQVSTTATSTHSTTLDTTIEGSVSVEAGVDFLGLADAKATATIGGSLSSAIEDATGMAYMSGNSTSVTNTVPIHLGNRGAVTFTPTYKCITGPLDCGKGPSDPIKWCQPDMSGPGGSINGDYNAVAFG